MIAAWMVYTIAVTLLAFVAASSAEYVLRALRIPTRFVWLTATLCAIGLSGRAIAGRRAAVIGPDAQSRVAGLVERAVVSTQASLPRAARDTTAGSNTTDVLAFDSYRIKAATRRLLTAVRQAPARLDVAQLARWDTVLAAVWIAGSLAFASWLALSLGALRRIQGGLSRDSIDGHAVLLSDELGPALVGIVDPQIVIPRWVLALPPADRATILDHEAAHAAARDPLVIAAGFVALVLMPWNVAAWMIVARLRLAVETDCDERVLRRSGDARSYGKLLIAVSERSATSGIAAIAFVRRSSGLERRIRRMMRRPRPASTSTVLSIGALVLSCVAALALSIPVASAAAPPVRTPSLDADGRGSASRATARPDDENSINQARVDSVARPDTMLSATLPVDTPLDSAPTINAIYAREYCGFGTRANEVCSADGIGLIQVLDGRFIVIAIRDEQQTDRDSVDHLFLVTTLQPMLDLPALTRGLVHIEYQHGEIYIVDREHGHAPLYFGSSQSRFRTLHPEPRSTPMLVGIAQYAHSRLSFDDLQQLRRSAGCDLGHGVAAPGSPGKVDFPATPSADDGCYEVGHEHVWFP